MTVTVWATRTSVATIQTPITVTTWPSNTPLAGTTTLDPHQFSVTYQFNNPLVPRAVHGEYMYFPDTKTQVQTKFDGQRTVPSSKKDPTPFGSDPQNHDLDALPAST